MQIASTSVHRTIEQKKVFLGMAVLLGCMAFFGFDVCADIVDHGLNGDFYEGGEIVHLAFESVAVAGMGYAVITLRAYLRLLQAEVKRSSDTLYMLRENFDEVLLEKFEQWCLTEAERDITMLMIRGLSGAKIATARNTAQGTVKAQSTAIFRKIGVSSKTELMSVIIDEFLHVDTKAARP